MESSDPHTNLEAGDSNPHVMSVFTRSDPTNHIAIDISSPIRESIDLPLKPDLKASHTSVADDYTRSSQAAEWEISDCQNLPYLERVKELSSSYPTLRYLSDWMQVGTTPARWETIKENTGERERRAKKTIVTCMQYMPGEEPTVTEFLDADLLKTFLDANLHEETSLSQSERTTAQPLRIFVVEDLSLQVTELLGSRFNVDPFFFREHIHDAPFYGTKQSWAKIPALTANAKRRKWFSIKNVRIRYHLSYKSFQEALVELKSFNVMRKADRAAGRPNGSEANKSKWNNILNRTTVWIDEDAKCDKSRVAIILTDPTTTSGHQLWHGRPNWLPIEAREQSSAHQQYKRSHWYKEIIAMTANYPWFSSAAADTLDLCRVHVPVFFIICAEWFLVCEHARSNLGRIENALDHPRPHIPRESQITHELNNLAALRREIPTWRAMVSETLEQSLPAAARLTCSNEDFEDISTDFKRVLSMLDDCQSHLDRLSERGYTETQLLAARQSLKENHNLARLTWLATIFVPLTFMTGLFSMSEDLGAMKHTFQTYFTAAVPLTVTALLIARYGYLVMREVVVTVESI